MNDPSIREAFHKTYLQKDHRSKNTLVIDELGLHHGKSRADIAVINGHIIGYEIKSERDSLVRLEKQIEAYDSIFDYSYIILEEKHLSNATTILPPWWGIILAMNSTGDIVEFEEIRKAILNTNNEDFSIAQLLWKNEAQEILINLGIKGAKLRESREFLYAYMVEAMDSIKLRKVVREIIKNRKDWRDPSQSFQYDGSYQFVSR